MNTAIQTYGSNQEIASMAQRFKLALRGGDKLNDNETRALAQVAMTTKLNPFIGEIWYIPGKGTMIGIAGARRLWQEQSKAGGGFSFVEIIACAPSDAGATEGDVVAAFKAIAHDSRATREYQKLFSETLAALRSAGSTDPVKEAREIIGPKPEWVGYGYSTKSETSRMNKMQLARKRAEADALKKCINIPFGVEVASYDVAPEYVDAVVTSDAGIASGEEQARFRNENPPVNGSRPYDPATLKAKILDNADKLSAGALKGTEAQMISMNLNTCFDGNEDKRKALLFYLTNHSSVKDLDTGWLLALKKWINVTKDADGKWFMDPMAVKEANAAFIQAMKDAGQMDFLSGAEEAA